MWLLTRMESPQISPYYLSKIIWNSNYRKKEQNHKRFLIKISIRSSPVYILFSLVSFWAFYISVLFFKPLYNLSYYEVLQNFDTTFWHCPYLVITYNSICFLLTLAAANLYFISVFVFLEHLSLYHYTLGFFASVCHFFRVY